MLYRYGRTEKENGFTLVEILIAVSVLSIGILGIASMQIASIHGNSTANGMTEGINSGSARVEDLLERGLQNYNSNDLIDVNKDGVAGLNNATTATADRNAVYGRYTICWNIAEDEFIPGTKTVNIIVTWPESGIIKSTSLRYAIPEYY